MTRTPIYSFEEIWPLQCKVHGPLGHLATFYGPDRQKNARMFIAALQAAGEGRQRPPA